MRRQGQVVRYRTDYILGTDRRLLQNVTVRDTRHNTDHYMVLGCLPGAPLATTKRYHGAAFHAARETMMSGLSDVGHEETGTGGAVPD